MYLSNVNGNVGIYGCNYVGFGNSFTPKKCGDYEVLFTYNWDGKNTEPEPTIIIRAKP